jgi:hypothetical protein
VIALNHGSRVASPCDPQLQHRHMAAEIHEARENRGSEVRAKVANTGSTRAARAARWTMTTPNAALVLFSFTRSNYPTACREGFSRHQPSSRMVNSPS